MQELWSWLPFPPAGDLADRGLNLCLLPLLHQKAASLIAQLVKNPPAMQETPVPFLSREDPLEKGQATHSGFFGFPCGPADDESTCNAGDLGSIPGLGRSPGERKGYPLQYSGLENSMDSIVHMVTESDLTERLSLSLPLHHLGNPHQAKRALNWSCRAGAPSYTHPGPRIRSLESKNLCFIYLFFLSLCFRNKFSR